MRHFIYVLCLSLAIFSLSPAAAYSQLDELREVTGLPIANDQPIIFGRVTLRGLPPTEKKPTVNVALLIGGTQVDRMKADDKGYFYFLRAPRTGSMLVFELDNIEVGRQLLVASGARVRQDLEINWAAFGNRRDQAPSIISAKPEYDRNAENDKLFIKGTAALGAKKYSDAVKALNLIVASDAADYVAWAELGTAYFNDGKLDESDGAYAKALQLKPDYLLALINRGKLQLARNQNENAVATLSSAIISEPNSADAHQYLGESYLRMKLGSKAVPHLNEAIRLAPIQKAEIHLRLAALYNAAGAKKLAANEYKMFLDKIPAHPDKDKFKKYIDDNLR